MTTLDVGSDARYRDPELAVDERVEDLLARMTLEEKAAQLGSRFVFELATAERTLVPAASELLQHGLGQVTRISGASDLHPAQAAAVANAVQRHVVEETRLGIPAIVHEEICSGLMARDSIVFPQAIGLAATWEPALVEALADGIRQEMRARGAHQGLGPLLDVCREPRWGRLEETFGEDPQLVTEMGLAFVRGLQGDGGRSGVIATGKHLVGYGASEGGRNWAPPSIAPRELRDVYLSPFEAVVRSTGLRSIMNAYNELDGVPCVADRDLFTGILRDEWGFEGFVVTDYYSARQLESYHRFVSDGAEAAAVVLAAGIDVELPTTDCFGEPLLDAARSGRLDIAVLDQAVCRVLRAKFELGLFERPYVDPEQAATSAGTATQRELARTIALKSLVLLRNDGTLPLAKGIASIAVIGPCADDARTHYGDYAYPAHVESLPDLLKSGDPFHGAAEETQETTDAGMVTAPTVLAALRERFGDRVAYARGCHVSEEARDGFDEAVAVAAAAEVAVVVVGDKSGLTDDSTTGESRDRASLSLPGVQAELVRAVAETGTPVVLVLVAGRPYGDADLHERCAAVLHAWLPGEEGAPAIVDTLLGDAAPAGKLPLSYPRSSGHLPVFYGHKISGGRSHWKGDYADAPVTPLYPFGFGLSYTTFALTDAAPRASEVPLDGTITVDVTVANTGPRAGEEVVQLYVRDVEATVTRPVLELKAFVRVDVAPGSSRRVTFDLPVGQLGFHGRDLAWRVEPGAFELFVGTSAADVVPAGTVTVLDGAALPKRSFASRVTVD